MKAKDVMRVLQISRTTLYRYVKSGIIKVDCEINGQYRYNAKSVFAIIGKRVPDEYK